MTTQQLLTTKLKNKTAIIGIIGLGYVGLPLSFRYAEAGYKVIGFDIDPAKTKQLNNCQSYIRHFGNKKVETAISAGFEATTDFTRTTQADALIICVPTPLKEHREPDISFVTETMDSLLPHMREGQVVSLESTTYPGTTEEELKPRIESTDLKVGRDAFLVKKEDPPAWLGRHAKFDNFWSLIVTPKCEPRSTTRRRNHETSRQFKSHTLGV